MWSQEQPILSQTDSWIYSDEYKGGLASEAFIGVKPDYVQIERQKPVLCCSWVLYPFLGYWSFIWGGTHLGAAVPSRL